MFSAIILPVLLQVGPNPTVVTPFPVPEELIEQRRLNRERQRPPLAIVEADPVAACAARADADPAGTLVRAQADLTGTSGLDRVIARHCLALALAAQEQWPDAAQAFAKARADLPRGNEAYAARLALAEAAAQQASGNAEQALAVLNGIAAPTEPRIAAAVAVDRARALVTLGRDDEAAQALGAARAADPDNDEAWLLSATLSRRQGQLDAAQQQIERAVILRPVGPDIALEAGVIAALAGRDDAALKSWRSVIETAPGTPAALTAAGYIAQVQGQ